VVVIEILLEIVASRGVQVEWSGRYDMKFSQTVSREDGELMGSCKGRKDRGCKRMEM
jgi:hypothetical protein